MRKIKFRVWDKEGHYSRDGKARILTIDTHPSSLTSIISHICLGGEIDNVELSQYTGLKDRHGVEIYEGDVVKDLTTKTYLGSKKTTARRGQVKYGDYYAVADDPYCSADVTGFYIDGDVFSSNLKDYFDKELEVIGNIYENPELLK